MVAVSRDSAAIRLEILGVHFGWGGAGWRDRRVLGTAGICRDPGLRADRNHIASQREPSFPAGEGFDWQGAARTGGEAGGRRRDYGPGRRRCERVLGWARRAECFR